MSNRTQEAVERQVEAMASEIFEVGLFKPAAQGMTPSEPEMLPRTWDKATLLKSLGWLRYQNSQGRNIYVRPKGEHSLSLIDDLSRPSLDRMKAAGFQPCLIVETSPGNFQAWVNHGQVLPKAESTAAARALATRFEGDKGAADWRHFGRLAGLTNRKPQHQSADGLFPFVRLIEATPGCVYPKAAAFIEEMRLAVQAVQQRSFGPIPAQSPKSIREVFTIDDFRSRPQYGGDGNRIDLAYAVYALARGVPEHVVRTAIASRDLSKKGSELRQADYIQRTIRKASAAVDGAPLGTSITISRTR
jgi:hypothetical protein